MTKYRVFKNVTELVSGVSSGEWSEIGDYTANDAKGAVKAAVLAMPADQQAKAGSETFAATPAGSWHEVSPKVDTTTVVSFA